MAPPNFTSPLAKRAPRPSISHSTPTRANLSLDGIILEAWAEGYNVGSIIILILIVFCNYRAGVLLHKLILLELVLALWHGTFMFARDPYYGWYLSGTATLLFISYQIHNVVSWLKIRPFLPRWGSRLFIGSLIAVQPYWIVECWSNWEYFNGLGSRANVDTRPWEALARDPWWIFTTWKLINAIKKTYGFKLWELVKISPRFGVMLGCMGLSIVFLLTDVLVTALRVTTDAGINPYWRFALVFKCASDTIFLDDFKSVLDEIVAASFRNSGGGGRATSTRRKTEPFVREFIEVDPVTTDISSQPACRPGRSKSMFTPFTSRDQRMSSPKIHVQQETTQTVSKLGTYKQSIESFDSNRDILARPPAAMSPDSDDISPSTSWPRSHAESKSEV